MSRFPIRYTAGKGAVLRSVLVLQRHSYVEVDGDTVRVRMSWAFSTTFSRRDIASVERRAPVPLTAGAHGWRGRWLVNGASGPLVGITFRSPVRAYVMGVPIKLRDLRVSVADADRLVTELGGAPGTTSSTAAA
jgi:hypothetical protein